MACGGCWGAKRGATRACRPAARLHRRRRGAGRRAQDQALPPPGVTLPRDAGERAATLTTTTRRLRAAEARWDTAGAVPRDVTYLALHHQRLLRRMATRRALGDAALRRLPRDVRGEASDTVAARRHIDGGEAAEDAQKRIGDSPLDVRMGGFATSFSEVNDQTRADLTTAELRLPDPHDPLAARLPRRDRGVAAAAARRDLDPRHAADAARDVGLRRHVAVRVERRDRPEPRPGGRLRAAAGLALPRGGRPRRRRDAGGAPAHRDDGRPDRRLSPASPSRLRWRR